MFRTIRTLKKHSIIGMSGAIIRHHHRATGITRRRGTVTIGLRRVVIMRHRRDMNGRITGIVRFTVTDQTILIKLLIAWAMGSFCVSGVERAGDDRTRSRHAFLQGFS